MKAREEILNSVINMLATIIGIDTDSIIITENIEEAYDADSTEMTELAAEVEKEFGVAISKTERDSWTTCESIVDSILAA